MPPSFPKSPTDDAPLAVTPAAVRLWLQPTARLIATALLAGLVVFAVPPAVDAADPSPADAPAPAQAARRTPATDPYDRAVLRELNRVRKVHRLPPLRFDSRIDRSADTHSQAQIRQGAVAHGAWNGRVASAAGHPSRVGEVIGWLGPVTPADEARTVVRGWLGSASHRPLVLDRGFRRAGLGRAIGPLGGYVTAVHTVDFATGR